MNIYPSYVFDEGGNLKNYGVWTTYKTWRDFEIYNNGLWFNPYYTLTLQSTFPYARVYYLEGNFNKGSVLQFPFPVYTTQTNFVKAFSHYNFTKQNIKENIIIADRFIIIDDVKDVSLEFYMFSDKRFKGLSDKYRGLSVALQPYISFSMNTLSNVIYNFPFKLQNFSSFNFKLNTIANLNPTLKISVPIASNIFSVYELATTISLSPRMDISYKVCSPNHVWYQFSTWTEFVNGWQTTCS